MMRRILCLSLLGSVGACGHSESEKSLHEELLALEKRTNDDVRTACDAPANVADLPNDDNGPEPVACYFELATSFNACELEALEAHPADARALMACLERDTEDILACCQRDGACTYRGIEPCYIEL